MLLVSLLLILFGGAIYVAWLLQRRYSKINQLIERRTSAIAMAHNQAKQIVVQDRDATNRERITVWLMKFNLVNRLNHKLMMSGKEIRLDEFLAAMVSIFVLFMLIFLVARFSFFLSLFLSALLAASPLLVLNILIDKRQSLLERQLPDVLDFIGRSLQAGHSFSSAMQMVASEAPEPISQEFQLASQQMNFGESVHNALYGLTQRISCPDMNFFAVAVVINREIGGDLAALLKHVSEMIRARLQLHMSIHAMTAEARASAWILGAIPVILAVILSVMQPKMMSLLITDPTGRKLLGGSLLVMGFGILWMRKMINIRV